MVYFLNLLLQNMELFGWIGLLAFFLLCLVCWLVASARTLVGPKTSPSCQVDEPYRCSEGRRGCIFSSWLLLFLMSMIYDFMMLKPFFLLMVSLTHGFWCLLSPSLLVSEYFFIVALLWRYKSPPKNLNKPWAVWISVCSQILENPVWIFCQKTSKTWVSQAFFL